MKRILSATILSMIVAGCVQSRQHVEDVLEMGRKVRSLATLEVLRDLAPPRRKMTVAVYNFPDLTGAFKPNDGFAVYSRAVTQGASAMVVDALLSAGRGRWFSVVEREGLNALLQERKLTQSARQIRLKNIKKREEALGDVTETLVSAVKAKSPAIEIVARQQSDLSIDPRNRLAFTKNSSQDARLVSTNPGQMQPIFSSGDNLESAVGLVQASEKKELQTDIVSKNKKLAVKTKAKPSKGRFAQTIDYTSLAPLRVLDTADYIVQGGVVGYDTDTVTSGAGLKILNIGGFGEVRQDIVTINLRLVDVRTGRIVVNTTMTKGIFSQKLQGSGFAYVATDRILEAEAGIAYNEPVYEALNLAIQAAVLDMINKGRASGLLS